MARFDDAISDSQAEFITRQAMFFVATAPNEGRLNLSPKGLDTFRVLGPNRVAYLDLTGSGNETAAHILQNGRVTIMFCAFEDPPLILRLYGRGSLLLPGSDAFEAIRPDFGPLNPGERQLVVIDVDSVQSSCGYAVPQYELQGSRDTLKAWAERKGPDGLVEYRAKKNTTSIDGRPIDYKES